MFKKIGVLFFVFILFFGLFAGKLFAQETDKKKSCLKELGLFFGYASGDLIDKDDYELVPAILRLGFDLEPFLNKFHIDLPGITEIELEPFVNTVVNPDSNVEAGFNLLFKYAYPLTERIYPYLEGGAGFLYMSQHTLEQATQYNFIPQAGAGLTLFLQKDKLALSAGYRYRHLSNASIKHPNKGINVDMVLVGMSLFY